MPYSKNNIIFVNLVFQTMGCIDFIQANIKAILSPDTKIMYVVTFLLSPLEKY